MGVNVLGAATVFDASFDFACDWEVLHHVLPEHRPRYVANVHRMLRVGGCYLSVCFSVCARAGQAVNFDRRAYLVRRHSEAYSERPGRMGHFVPIDPVVPRLLALDPEDVRADLTHP